MSIVSKHQVGCRSVAVVVWLALPGRLGHGFAVRGDVQGDCDDGLGLPCSSRGHSSLRVSFVQQDDFKWPTQEEVLDIFKDKPPWWYACLGAGILVVVLLLIYIMWRCCCASAPPEEVGPPPEQRLVQLRKERTKALMQQAVQKQKLGKIIESMVQIEYQAAHPGTEGEPPIELTKEELAKKTEDAITAQDLLTERKLASALAYLSPVAIHGNRIYDAFNKRMVGAQDKASRLITEEVENMTTDLQGVFQVEDLKSGVFDTLSDFEVPSLATLMAAALAPAQLKVLLLWNQFSCLLTTVFAGLSVFVLLFDRHLSCGDLNPREVYTWYLVDISIATICLCVRFWVILRVSWLIADLDEAPTYAENEDPLKVLRIMLDYYLTTGADALARYDLVMSSFMYSVANWQTVFAIGWMTYGTDIVFNTTWDQCVTAGLVILRIRVLFFLILIIPAIVNMVLFFVGKFMESERFKLAVVAGADGLDEFLGLGLPLAGILTQAYLVRNQGDMVALQLRRYELQRMDLELKQKQAEATLREVALATEITDREIDRLEGRRVEEYNMTEDDILAREEAAKKALLEGTENLIRKMNESALEAQRNAEEQFSRWQQGQGPESMVALSRGQGVQRMQDYLAQIDTEEIKRQARLTSEEFLQQEWVQDSMQKGVDITVMLQEHELMKQQADQAPTEHSSAAAR